MANQTIGLGSVADDGTGDTLRAAGDKINDNFLELYNSLGDGTTLDTPVTTASPTFTGTIAGATLDLSGDLTVGKLNVEPGAAINGKIDMGGTIKSISNEKIEKVVEKTA